MQPTTKLLDKGATMFIGIGLFSDIFSPYSTFGERFRAFVILLVEIVVIGLLVFVAFCLIDSVAITPTKTTTTTIEAKQITPAHTTMIMAGKVMVPQYYPESYQLLFEIKGEEISSSVEKEFFDCVVTNDKIEVDYGFGRLSGLCVPVTIKTIGK